MLSSSRVQSLGPYRMGDRLGVGGMAEVFAAESDLHGAVALKRILPGLAQDQEFADMFLDEARITSRFNHGNVVKVLDYGRIGTELYMALEYVSGPNLARVLRTTARKKIHFDLGALLAIVTQLLDGLHYVHHAQNEAGVPLEIVHRDVSPGNVMLRLDGVVKLADFGIVRSQAVARRTQPGELKGKIGYMSPEQALGAPVSLLSDIFSVGIILAEFLTLKPLFLGKNEVQTLSRTASVDLTTWQRYSQEVPKRLREITEKALRLAPERRHQSAQELRAELLDFAAGAQVSLGQENIIRQLRELELLPRETCVSGERRIRPRALSPVVSSEEPTMIQLPGVPFRARGQVDETLEFSQSTLPYRLLRALREVEDGVVEMHEKSEGGARLAIELTAGRIVAVHESTGIMPLGRMLLDASLILPSDLPEALGESRRAHLRLGQYLVLHGRLRESLLLRLLRNQAEARLSAWFSKDAGYISTFKKSLSRPENHLPESCSELLHIFRKVMYSPAFSGLDCYLEPVLDAVVLPQAQFSVELLSLSAPESRVLATVLEDGVYVGHSIRYIIKAIATERIATKKEAIFSLLAGLSLEVIGAPGFGKSKPILPI